MADKHALRRTLIAQRRAIAPEARAQLDATIVQQVIAWWQAQPVQCIGVYWPIQGEPDLHAAYAYLTAQRVQLALPLVSQSDAPLSFAPWVPGGAMVTDCFGVAVPAHSAAPVHPAALLIPCVGFNAAGFRLGYGGGFYDRTLALAQRPLAIGIAYAAMLAEFDTAPHDIALDRIITDATS